jgi:hypothetical protein
VGWVLKEVSKVEQRYDAVLGVIWNGFSVTEVAEAYGSADRACMRGWPVMNTAGELRPWNPGWIKNKRKRCKSANHQTRLITKRLL